jgi:multisubunit Na+/H+ antiporter MnhE subunit
MRSLYGEWTAGWKDLPYELRVLGLFVGGVVGQLLVSILGVDPSSLGLMDLLAYAAVVFPCLVASTFAVVAIRASRSRAARR